MRNSALDRLLAEDAAQHAHAEALPHSLGEEASRSSASLNSLARHHDACLFLPGLLCPSVVVVGEFFGPRILRLEREPED